MKKIFAYSLIALSAALLSVSCEKVTVNVQPVEKPVMRTVTCTIGNPDTKVSIDPANGKTEWEVDDEILFHGRNTGGEYSTVVKLTAGDISEDKKSFTVTIPEFNINADQNKWADSGSSCASNIIAAYPASAVAVDNGASNWYAENKFNDTNLPLMSGFNDGYDSNNLIFYNLCGVLSFIVTEDVDGYTLTGNGSEAVSYTGYSSRLCKKTDDTIRTEWVYAGTPVTTLTGSVTPGEETRIFIPNGVSFSGGFTINFSKGEDFVKTLSTDKSVSIPRNSYRPMGDVTAYLKDYVAPAPPDENDLSAEGSANCYIIYEAGEYKFKAVKGNSNEAVAATEAVVLWETFNNSVQPNVGDVIASVEYADGYITFETPATFKAGNAVIAAKDGEGTILWSWHIWAPKETVTTADYTEVIGAYMMNMNLGALEAVPATGEATIASLGLWYQWGRKDPFPGARDWDSYPSVIKIAGAEFSKADPGVVEVDKSVKNPTVYYYVGSDDNGSWTSSTESLWAADTKTTYDPCPPGYKVPGATGSIWTQSDEGWTMDLDNHVVEFAGIRFPFAGYVECYGGSNYGTGGGAAHLYLWSATKYDSNRGRCVYYRTSKSEGSRYYGAKRGKANAASVRCVKE